MLVLWRIRGGHCGPLDSTLSRWYKQDGKLGLRLQRVQRAQRQRMARPISCGQEKCACTVVAAEGRTSAILHSFPEATQKNTDANATNFYVSTAIAQGTAKEPEFECAWKFKDFLPATSTGVSAADRATTARAPERHSILHLVDSGGSTTLRQPRRCAT